jgi:hypothetical protein
MAEIAAGGGFRGIGPNEEAEALAGDGLQAGGEAVEEGAGLAAGDDKGVAGPLHAGRTQQIEPQACPERSQRVHCCGPGELFGLE